MKVFLVVPRCWSPKHTYREYPLGVGLIATALRRQGHDVAVYDQNVEGGDDELLLARLAAFDARVVGFSVVTPAYPAAQRQIQRLKICHPQAFVVAGGIHASLFPDDFLAAGADAVVVGAGVEPMRMLVERLDGGQPWQNLPGWSHRGGEGRIIRGPSSTASLCAADPEIVERDVFNLPLYTHHSLFASQGCPHRCRFCCNYSGRMLHDGVSVRSFDAVCAELHYLANRFGATQAFFVDDVFFLTRHKVLAFCHRLAQEELGIQWMAQLRADCLDPAVAEAMVATNCRRIYLGVEAGSEGILRRSRKGLDREAIRLSAKCPPRAVSRCCCCWTCPRRGREPGQWRTCGWRRETGSCFGIRSNRRRCRSLRPPPPCPCHA